MVVIVLDASLSLKVLRCCSLYDISRTWAVVVFVAFVLLFLRLGLFLVAAVVAVVAAVAAVAAVAVAKIAVLQYVLFG